MHKFDITEFEISKFACICVVYSVCLLDDDCMPLASALAEYTPDSLTDKAAPVSNKSSLLSDMDFGSDGGGGGD